MNEKIRLKILSLIKNNDKFGLSATNLRELTGHSRDTILSHLFDLEKNGEVISKKIGTSRLYKVKGEINEQ